MPFETNAGRGVGKPTYKIIEEHADKLAFTFYNLNVPLQSLIECEDGGAWEPECSVKSVDLGG